MSWRLAARGAGQHHQRVGLDRLRVAPRCLSGSARSLSDGPGALVPPGLGSLHGAWWVSPESRPTAAEAAARLSFLSVWGPSPRAFTVLHRCPTPGGIAGPVPEPDAGGSRETAALDAAGGQGLPRSGRRGPGYDEETGTFWVGDPGFEPVTFLGVSPARFRVRRPVTPSWSGGAFCLVRSRTGHCQAIRQAARVPSTGASTGARPSSRRSGAAEGQHRDWHTPTAKSVPAGRH
jgi:hypothetical protein